MIKIKMKFFRSIINKIKDPEYWFSVLIQYLYVSFVTALWVYLWKKGLVSADLPNILIYFGFVSTFNYLFHYSLTNRFVNLLKNELDDVLLLPKNIFVLVYKKLILPDIVSSVIPSFFVFILAVVFRVITIDQIPLFLGLLFISHLHNFFLSISGALLGEFISWSEYLGFTLRFLGQTWNGAFIPYAVFSSSIFNKLLKFTPFVATGLFLQPLWGGMGMDQFINLGIISLLQILTLMILSALMLKLYIKNKRD